MNLAEVPLQPPGTHVFDDAELATAERRLVRIVGPMARILVRQASARAPDLRALYAMLASHIDDPHERERFNAAAAGETSGAHTLSHWSECCSDAPHDRGADGQRTHAHVASARAGVHRPDDIEACRIPRPDREGRRAQGRAQARDSEEFVQIVAEHIGTQDREAFLHDVGTGD